MTEFMEFMQLIIPKFIEGTKITLLITFVSLTIGIVLGLISSLLRIYSKGILQKLAIAYIEIFRGTPLLVQLFIVYYGLPDLGVTLSPLASAFFTLGINSGAYQAEYFRSTIQAIGASQMLAARSIGMTLFQSIRHIILPQALRLVIPVWSNEAVGMLKYSAVVYIIAIPDLLGQAKLISAFYFNPLEVFPAVTIAYIILVSFFSFIVQIVEKRLKLPGLEVHMQSR